MDGEIFRTCPDRPWDPTQPPIQIGTGSFPGVKRPGRGVDHPTPLSPKLEEEYSYTSTLPLDLRELLYGDLYHLPRPKKLPSSMPPVLLIQKDDGALPENNQTSIFSLPPTELTVQPLNTRTAFYLCVMTSVVRF